MIDREKVIKGLECCIMRDPDDHTRCGECPYEGTMCVNRLKIEALALLKAQEPRVTREEAECASNQDWSGAQGNDSERIKEQAERSNWGIFG